MNEKKGRLQRGYMLYDLFYAVLKHLRSRLLGCKWPSVQTGL
jgi:hypothetical protein